MTIDVIQNSTECMFARQATLEEGPTWNSEETFEENMGRQAAALSTFVRIWKSTRADGFVLQLPGQLGSSVETLAHTVNSVLRTLASLDPLEDDVFGAPIETPNWRFKFQGQILFVLSFGPCYMQNNSRYGFGGEDMFILLQPDDVFARYCAPGERTISTEVRDAIRIAYAQAGRVYDLDHTLSPYEAHRFVKPARLRQPPVRWWTCDYQ